MKLIKSAVRELLSPRTLERLRRIIEKVDPFLLISFSQEGEDLIVRRKFEGQDRGFYVDVGAHHPTRFSNTMSFYRRGWRGINIDPNPAAIRLFERERPSDVNLCEGVDDSNGKLTFYIFDEPAISTFDANVARELERSSPYKIVERRNVAVRKLSDILEEKLPSGQIIDLMSIDVEGLDLRVMKSNDWERFRPRCLLVEARDINLGHLDAHPLHRFALSANYRIFAKTVNTLMYEDERPRAPATTMSKV